MKLPKTFMPEKDLEERTEELLEEKEIKPKLDPKITAVDEVLGELDNNPKYYDSNTFNSNIYVAINQKGYGVLGGLPASGNTYFIRTKEPDKVELFIRTFEKKNMHYCLAVTKRERLEEFVEKFNNFNPKTNYFLKSENGLNFLIKNLLLVGIFGVNMNILWRVLPHLFKNNNFDENTVASFAVSMLLTGLYGKLAGVYAYQRNKKKMKECYEEIILDEKEAVRKALK